MNTMVAEALFTSVGTVTVSTEPLFNRVGTVIVIKLIEMMGVGAAMDDAVEALGIRVMYTVLVAFETIDSVTVVGAIVRTRVDFCCWRSVTVMAGAVMVIASKMVDGTTSVSTNRSVFVLNRLNVSV